MRLCPQADYYSFTLSWSRLLPDGNSSQENEEGVAFLIITDIKCWESREMF